MAEAPFVYIQWKGSEVCFDFHCACGAFIHADAADFAYYLECPECEAAYEMPSDLPLKPLPSYPEGAAGLRKDDPRWLLDD